MWDFKQISIFFWSTIGVYTAGLAIVAWLLSKTKPPTHARGSPQARLRSLTAATSALVTVGGLVAAFGLYGILIAAPLLGWILFAWASQRGLLTQLLTIGLTLCLVLVCVRIAQHRSAVARIRALGGSYHPGWWTQSEVFHSHTTVDLSFTGAGDADLAVLKYLWHPQGITYAKLNGTLVTDDGLGNIKCLTRLEVLKLADTRISDTGLEHLKALKELRHLDLSGTQVTREGVIDMRRALRPSLEVQVPYPK